LPLYAYIVERKKLYQLIKKGHYISANKELLRV